MARCCFFDTDEFFDYTGLQEPGQATPLRIRDELEGERRWDRAQSAEPDPVYWTLESILGQSESIWLSGRRVAYIMLRQHPSYITVYLVYPYATPVPFPLTAHQL